MKKISSLFLMGCTSILLSMGVAAESISPATGEQVNRMPFIFGGIALVLIAALIILSIISKKK